ncbi:hypothetical protein V5O48_004180 [Marasmius crinis-equi]|uniref:Uncharacterized protein n=1 Tax=Marasmius crinis-equi TaxID=585013 RepID=A0ABR3FQX4_9AGAR
MESICLSSAPNLRCFPLTQNEFIGITIPTGLEILFSTYLVFANRGKGRKHLFLVAEGWFYFALALLELLMQILPAVRGNLNASRIIDITIGAASSVPLLFYVLFLFLFTSSETLDAVPSRFQRIGKALLILFIPLIIASNSVASFVGVTHQVAILNGKRILAVKATNPLVHKFLSSFALAFLTAYQAMNFSFAFFRLTRAFINSRRIERDSADEVVLFKGMGWITGGLKLGAIETVIGFAEPGFETSLVRRIFRLLARACLVIGLVKGVDFSEDFRVLQDEMANRNKSKKGFRASLRPFISNPRFSTFRQLSPTASSFHRGTRSPGITGMDTFAAIKATVDKQERNPRQRVTIHFDETSGTAPTLEMRFSTLDMPSPALIAESIKARPASEWIPSTASRRASSSWYVPSESAYSPQALSVEMPIPPLPSELKRSATMPSVRTGAEISTAHAANMPSLSIRNAFANMSTTDLGHHRGPSDMSAYSLSRSMVDEFPQIPQPPSNEDLKESLRLGLASEPNTFASAPTTARTAKSGTLSASSSLKRKPVPVYVPEPLDPFDDEDPDDRERQSTVNPYVSPLPSTHYTFGTPTSRGGFTASTPGSDMRFDPPNVPRHRQMGSSSLTTPMSIKHDSMDSAGPEPAYAKSISVNSSNLSASGSMLVPPEGRIVSISPSEFLPLSTVQESAYSSSGSGTASPLVFGSPPTAALPESALLPKERRSSPPRQEQDQQQHGRGKSMETIDISWLHSAGPKRPGAGPVRDSLNTYVNEVQVERATRTQTLKSKPSLTRIKSVGKAPRRYTPEPERTEFATRGSVYVEPIVIPPRSRKMSEMEVVQGSVDSSVMGGPLRDSDVWGSEHDVYSGRY